MARARLQKRKAEIVSTLGRQLELEFGRGFADKNLRRMVQLAEVFPDPETLTLEGEMPSLFDPARSVRVREVIELKSPDQKVATTSLQGEDGNWFTLVTVNARGKK